MQRSPLMNVMVQAVLKAGRGLKRDFGEIEQLQVSLKGPGDFVSAADRRSEEILRAELAKARPDFGFLGEEGGETPGKDPTQRWVVDPLDGTTNFLHGIPQFAISVGLEKDRQVIAGVIYNPATEDLYTAEKGRGAFLNDRRLRVAGRRAISDCVIGCGVPHIGIADHAGFRRELEAVQAKAAGIRRFGAAALDLAFVAAGRLDGFWERGLHPWDIAAGIVLIKEAGGFVTDPAGHDRMLETGALVAGNEWVHKELSSLIART